MADFVTKEESEYATEYGARTLHGFVDKTVHVVDRVNPCGVCGTPGFVLTTQHTLSTFWGETSVVVNARIECDCPQHFDFPRSMRVDQGNDLVFPWSDSELAKFSREDLA